MLTEILKVVFEDPLKRAFALFFLGNFVADVVDYSLVIAYSPLVLVVILEEHLICGTHSFLLGLFDNYETCQDWHSCLIFGSNEFRTDHVYHVSLGRVARLRRVSGFVYHRGFIGGVNL